MAKTQESRVEAIALASSPQAPRYAPLERLDTIVVANFPALGKLAALRFLEWAQQNPGGVISLPTGKTPEPFIYWVRHLLAHWETPAAQETLNVGGVDPALKPDMASFHFVQIDDFYPIDPEQHNSFYQYVQTYYIDGFGLDPKKALLINSATIGLSPGETFETIWPDNHVDLSLRHRAPQSALEANQQACLQHIDDWCAEYEDKIRALGGIGFFLGGIGPDGHIGFNVRGSDHHSTTRLTATNYETQAAAAADFGGIEVARTRLVITIGLNTITYNPMCVALIMAAGEAKASVVADAIESSPTVRVPATALHALPQARFYLTFGAAKGLHTRKVALLARQPSLTAADAERHVINLALTAGKRIIDLTREDFKGDSACAIVLKRRAETSLETLKEQVRDGLIRKIEQGSIRIQNTRFLHTEPHHDDVMLGYLPGIVRNIRDASNEHHFATLTSGFTAVTNDYLKERITHMLANLSTADFAALFSEGYFAPDNPAARYRDVWQYLDGVAAQNAQLRDESAARNLVRNLIEIYGLRDVDGVTCEAHVILAYLEQAYPGQKDPVPIQTLKGMCREWEVETLWGYFGWNASHVHHLRLGFYKGDLFTEEPTESRDVSPIIDLLESTEPDILTVALDPEASGPDTHYKVLQAIAAAVQHRQVSGTVPQRIWGYRNVWYRFHPADANLFIPVSLNMFAIMDNAFRNTFISQKKASFPSHAHDGPFCELAQKIQVEQYQILKTCLGREWFHEHHSPLIRAARGFVFINNMDLETFFRHSRRLKALAGEA